MTYSGAAQAAESRALLGTALEALQKDPKIPKEVLAVAENLAGAVGALFEAERASSDVDGKSSVKHAMGSLSQTMALLQDVKSDHEGIADATPRAGDAEPLSARDGAADATGLDAVAAVAPIADAGGECTHRTSRTLR